MGNRYVILTAAKNEEAYIANAIESVLRQSVLPLAWFIMDDGSTDRTAAIVGTYAARHPFIHLHATGQDLMKRDFGSKDRAINAAYALAKRLDFEFVGVQDADIAPEKSCYYEAILHSFQKNPRLGIAGGYIYEQHKELWHCRKHNSMDWVAGGIQMFRRICFDEIDGFTPLRYGGADSLTQINARLRGWEIQTCPDLRVFHYRRSSTANGKWRGLFREGMMDASFGSHPIFELFKCCGRATSRPIVAGGAIRFCGYLWWKFTGRKPLIQPGKVAFLRKQQLTKLKNRLWPLGARSRRQPSGF